jgi:prepilin-type N-terminal cleavage/methylation domain-containing protein
MQLTPHIIKKPSQRGFTLLELLITIGIIAILASLLLPAIMGARARVKDAEVKSELSALEIALAAFQKDYGVFPPSSIVLCENPTDWNSTAAEIVRSKAILRQIWPNFDFTIERDYNDDNGDGIVNNAGDDEVDIFSLNGAECLVTFLGGVIEPQISNDKTEYVPKGFSKNPANPFEPTTVSSTRYPSYFDFDIGRLVPRVNGGISYLDKYVGQLRPIWYLSSYDGRGYRYEYPSTVDSNPDFDIYNHELPTIYNYPGLEVGMYVPYLQAGHTPLSDQDNTTNRYKANHQPWKKSSFQLISPGRDFEYGTGGIYKEGARFDHKGRDTTDAERKDYDFDNITNFAGGKLSN